MRKKTNLIIILSLFLFIFFLSCAHINSNKLNNSIKNTQIFELLDGQLSSDLDENFYLNKVQPIFNKRCIACHACGEAPCSLYLTSYDGVRRGSRPSPDLLLGTKPFRLKDAKNISEWRDRGFTPVLHNLKGEENLQYHLIYKFIEHSMDIKLSDSKYNLKTSREPKSCEGNFHIGMPYGLPALTDEEFEIIKAWAKDGSVGPSPKSLEKLNEPSNPQIIKKWEDFLNNKNPKSQLYVKYIYEHSFLTHIHFENTPDSEFYELVRSRTVNPFPIDEIVTERPNDPITDPLFFYRFKKVTDEIVKKTHIPWELSDKELEIWKSHINDPSWKTSSQNTKNIKNDLIKFSDNPFERFKDIPTKYRYRFLLENSYMIVNSMIKGPVCIGLNATSAIRDHFWVLFLKPEEDKSIENPEIEREWKSLLKVKNPIKALTTSALTSDERYSVNSIWNGDGFRKNALLTVFRHEESASVHQGLIGGQPNTVWLLNYSNFERIYYNLVVEFKPWGNAIHQLSTFDAMTEHRKEAEERFLLLFPKEYRKLLYDQFEENYFENKIKIKENTKSPYENSLVLNLINNLLQQLNPIVTENKSDIGISSKGNYLDWEKKIENTFISSRSKIVKHIPNITYIIFEEEVYTILRTKYYKFNDIALVLDYGRNPNFDAIVVLKGLYGDRPELILNLNENDTEDFIDIILDPQKTGEESWTEIKAKYSISRFKKDFWSYYDNLNKFLKERYPLEAGVIDLNQLEIK